MSDLYVMDRSGHRSTFTWGNTPDEEAQAKAAFDQYVAKGFTMYRLKKKGGQGRRITQFESDAHGIIAVPRMVGG